MSQEIGAYDAKTKLPELLRRVGQGERFTITHRGKPIAELGPSKTEADRLDAILALKSLRKIPGVSSEMIREMIDEGRR